MSGEGTSMIRFFEEQRADIFAHAAACYPNEACGVIIDGAFVSCVNRAADPQRDFRIDFEKEFAPARYHDVQAVVHSHGDQPHITRADMIAQIVAAKPFGMVNVVHGVPNKIVWWGDQLEIQPLVGRPFEHGVYDCSATVRDWYRSARGIVFPETPRDWNWWQAGQNILEKNIREFGFDEIDPNSPLVAGDVLLFTIGRGEGGVPFSVVNHSAVYIGDHLILHHLYKRLSRREPVISWMRHAKKTYRYPGLGT
jgi:cell wall-associated NlpC family hydrolase